MTDVSGESIGGYRLGRLIGEGGMGLVWEAEQVSLSRMVALKLIRAELAADPDFRTRCGVIPTAALRLGRSSRHRGTPRN